MSNINSCTFTGRLGAMPELKEVNDSFVCNFSLAVNESYKNKSGEKVENTEWVRCQLWGESAKFFANKTEKGSRVLVEGKLKTRSYEKDGEKKFVTEIKVSKFEIYDFKDDDNGGGFGNNAEIPF